MARKITWSLGTEVNQSSSFNTKIIGPALNFLGNYWDIYFEWVITGGRINFNLAKSPNPGWAAWTSGFTARINVDYNFNVGPTKDVLCAYVIAHEFGHMVLPNGVGGNVHSKTLGLMHPNCNMPAGNLYEADYPWFKAYPWKPGLKAKPHQEPGRMKAAFMPKTVGAHEFELEAVPLPTFGCNHEPVKRSWYDVRPQSWLVP